MVEWNGWYLAADRVSAIKVYKTQSPLPYRLEVVMVDATYHCDYETKPQCETAARRIAAKIERENSDRWDNMQNRLYLIDDAIKRIDRRQLRIWRILKALLNIDNGGVENE